MYAPFHSSRAVCTPGRCSGAWPLLFYKKGTCLSRGFHQLFTKEWGGRGVLPSPAFPFFSAPGERTISNAEVPLPRSPLSLAAGTAHREPPPVAFAEHKRAPEQGSEPRAQRGCPRRSGAGRKARKRTQVPFPGSNRIIEKSSGGSGGLFQESPGVSLPRSQPVPFPGSNRIIKESSGGSGGLFQESPGVSLPPVTASAASGKQ